jgi:serine/threonine protein kinase/DNA-binding winged helix-turn-helix (wHTH) protein/tetratricopeptide (TPR) repeat protein
MLRDGFPQAAQDVSERLWHFGGCEFNEMTLGLRVHGALVDLELKPLEVLLQLLQRAGKVVTKEELIDAVWPGLVVVDSSLATAVSKLRKALGDKDSSTVLTVSRVGYRMAVPVHSQPITTSIPWAKLGFKVGDAIPGRDHWHLRRQLAVCPGSEVWFAEHARTCEPRVFKFGASDARLRSLKREVTVSRFLRSSLGNRPEFVHILECNFETQPYFLESEYGGLSLPDWAESQGGLAKIPAPARLCVLAEVAKAVAAAHGTGVLHKDLKPANILVSRAGNGTWQVKVADFGSASLVEPARLKAMGITNLGLTQTDGPQSSSLTGTLMYLAPELLRGHRPSAATDIYALGVILYQLAACDFHKPLSPGWEADVQDPLVREDIAEAACGDPARRLTSAAELGDRLLALDRRRIEREHLQRKQRLDRLVERKRERARIRRPWMLITSAALLVALVVGVSLFRSMLPSSSRHAGVAVLPFQNAGSDHSSDFLRLALPDEIATQLSYTRSLAIRPFGATSKYTGPNLDLQTAGRAMGVASVVTGRFVRMGDRLQISLEAVDVESNRVLWRDTLHVPADNMIAMQEQLAAVSRGGLAPALGSPAVSANPAARPQNEEAYDLYLRSVAFSTDEAANKEAIGMLQSAVGLDPNYSPAWGALSFRYYYEASYAGGGESTMQRLDGAAERALALDPDNLTAAFALVTRDVEQGQLAKAYREAEDLVERRPDNAMAHFMLGYVLRYAGLLQEAANQCEEALVLDPRNPGWRSCSGVFLLRGDYQRSLDFVRLDQGSEWSGPHTIDALLREGKDIQARLIGPTHIPNWQSYNMLLACADHKPATEIAEVAKSVRPVDDPEANYYFASHLAYCGQTGAAAEFLRRAIEKSYCSYPAIDTDPFLASLRSRPEFAEIRSAAIGCQQKFLAQRSQHAQ